MRMIDRIHTVHSHPSSIIANCEDFLSGTTASDVISLKNAQGAIFMIVQNANLGGVSKVTVNACSNATPTTTEAMPFKYRMITAADTQGTITDATTTGFSTSTGANIVYIVDVSAEDLISSGYEFIQLATSETTDAAVDGNIACFLYGLRYADETSTQVS